MLRRAWVVLASYSTACAARTQQIEIAFVAESPLLADRAYVHVRVCAQPTEPNARGALSELVQANRLAHDAQLSATFSCPLQP